jgi:putative transcriptional regulator
MSGKLRPMQNTLEHSFLVAMPGTHGDVFDKSVVYIHEHSETGSMGIIINKPMSLSLKSVLEHLDIECDTHISSTQPVLMGGPVDQGQGFILHADALTSDETDEYALALSGSKETLRDIACGKGPEHYLIALGFSGWKAGQLDAEIRDNAWLNVPFDEALLFNTPIEQRFEKAAQSIGINIHHISSNIGHA